MKILHRNCSSSWMHGTPAGLPSGMPGMGLEIEGAVQQAPQCDLHCIARLYPMADGINAAKPRD
ncbi:hypothetical protein [Chitinibacter sp. S2-10]|uniref:hypothetical protein n=1 Tax=Chitinibacter sp. S2-10 TaxID=3373597 RepID=UPI0039778D21